MTDALATILLVEDEPEIRRFLRSALRAERYNVVEAANGRRGAIDAATAWFTARPKPTLIGLRINVVLGKASAAASLPSAEALSTTTASHSMAAQSACTDRSASVSS